MKVTAEEAIKAINPGASAVMPPGCGETQTLIEALVNDGDRLQGTKLYSGLLLTDYKFIRPEYQGKFKYTTWHVMRPVRDLVAKGTVGFLPVRGSQVPGILEKIGIDAAFIHVSPPDSNGYCSLGVSVSYPFLMARKAKLVIAEINEQMPRALGDCFIHITEIDYAVEVNRPLVTYQATKVDQVSQKIGSLVTELIPDGAVVQIGIGAIPEAILSLLKDSGKRISVYGMGIDALVDLAGAGALKPFPGKSACSVISTELMGTEKLFQFTHNNPVIEMYPANYTINPVTMSKLENFISINSALQVDFWGQANAEVIGEMQISGVGGGFDFVDGALFAPGGKTILAIPATTGKDKRSTIVPRLPQTVPATTPRHSVQYVVTEYGITDLSAKSLNERAESLIAIAAPESRDQLWEDYVALRKEV